MMVPEADRDKVIEAVLEGLRSGMTEYQSAKAAGISYPTWFRWRENIPGLNARQIEAKRARIPLLEDALWKAAMNGKVSAILAWLEKESKEWRDRAKDLVPQQLVVNGNAAFLIGQLPDEKKSSLMRALYNQGLLPMPPSKNGHNGHNGSGPNGTGAS